jgi:predicted nucleic acid-binding protein
MRVLLDTTIVIHREANNVVNRDIGVLFNWIDRLHHTKCVHPVTVEELQRHSDPRVVSTMGIKLQNYHLLATPAAIDPNLQEICSAIDVTNNDENDTKILNEVYCGRVDCLITEDGKIHRKAEALGIREKVCRIEAFLERVIAENPTLVDYKVLSVRKKYFGEINLGDTFFDSFREDYEGFNKWFNAKAGNNDFAYVCYDVDSVAAFLYLKIETEDENYVDITPPFSKSKRLKIGTLKVTNNGLRLGERFLKIVFDNALQFKVDEVYVTLFQKRPETDSLVSLLESFGFIYHGVKSSASGEEKVFVRQVKVVADRANPRKTFPRLSREARVLIVPIYPSYHTSLFPDSILNTESPDNFVEPEPHRNAISKSYISHAISRKVSSGDILVFYRTGDPNSTAPKKYTGVATTIGIAESIKDGIASFDDLKSICRRRTVLSDEELLEYWDYKPNNRPFVVDFLYAYSLKKRINAATMLESGIINSYDSLRPFTEISMEQFVKLWRKSKEA